MRVAYLVSRYPIVSHAFILREVAALRELGVEVDTFTVVRVERSELVEAETRAEDERTTALRPVSPARLAAAQLWALARRPRRYAAVLRQALALSPGGPRGAVWQLAYFAQAMLLARALHRRGIHHVHAHHANVASDVALLAAAYDPQGTWSFTMHGPTEFADVGHFRIGAKVAAADWVACISDFARAQLMALAEPEHWSKLELVHCGVELERFRPQGRERAAGPLRVLSVGRLAPQKGQHILVQAVADLRERGVEVHVTLVGDGPARASLERTIEDLGVGDAITLAGAVGHDRIGELYAASDAFCLSSFAEGVPVVLMEAMAMELPVVSPWVMGIPELIEDGVTGLLIPPARPDALAGALERLAGTSDEDRRAMGRRGRAKIEREFDQRAEAAKLRRLLTA